MVLIIPVSLRKGKYIVSPIINAFNKLNRIFNPSDHFDYNVINIICLNQLSTKYITKYFRKMLQAGLRRQIQERVVCKHTWKEQSESFRF